MQEHCARRNLAEQSLKQFALLMRADASQLPHSLHNIVAVMSYGKCEVLWYFRNVNEVCCALPHSLHVLPPPLFVALQDLWKVPTAH